MQSTDGNLLFIAGLGSTGSSALCDVLKEYDGILTPDEEWRIWVDPDGLLDLLRNTGPGTTLFQHIALKRFSRLVKRLDLTKVGPYSTLTLPDWVKSVYLAINDDVQGMFKITHYFGLWYGETNKLIAR